MHHFLFLNRKIRVAKRSGNRGVEKQLILTHSIGLVLLAVLRFILVLMLYLGQDREMIWLFYIYVFLDLPIKILFPPTPLLWVKYLVRIFLSKKRLWNYFMSLLLWDLTLLVLGGWMIIGFIFQPTSFERLIFILIPIAFSLMNSLLAFMVLLFSKEINAVILLAILVFGMALGAVNLKENSLIGAVLFSCVIAQWGLFTHLVRKEMFAV